MHICINLFAGFLLQTMPAYMNWSIVFLKHSPWPISLLLTGELIWDAFFLYGLICDSHDKSNPSALQTFTAPDRSPLTMPPRKGESIQARAVTVSWCPLIRLFWLWLINESRWGGRLLADGDAIHVSTTREGSESVDEGTMLHQA